MKVGLLFFFGAGLAILGPAAQPGIAQSQDVSPFLPPNTGKAAGSQAESGGLELRGIMSTAQGMRYCIFDPNKKISRWVSKNQGEFGFVVQSFDSEHDTVIVNQDGRRLTLALREAKVTVGAGPSMAGAPIGPPGPSVVPSAILRPTPEDEQRRLQAIAEEVRRRRLLREQQMAAPNPPRQQ